jgi:hypothetical protein
MEKSGEKATRYRSRKPRKNIVTFPPLPDASSKLSTAPEMVVPDTRSTSTTADAYLSRFLTQYKIGKRQLENCPKIEEKLRKVIGGRLRAIETLKFSPHPDAKKLLEFCQRIKFANREKVPFEAMCLAAGVDVVTIWGALILAARDVSRAESALITMMEHPEVVQATVDFAKKSEFASKDREMVHKAVGWLPTPKGSNINVNVFDPHKEAEEDGGEDGAPDLDDIFGSNPMEIEGWGNDRRKLLEANVQSRNR